MTFLSPRAAEGWLSRTSTEFQAVVAACYWPSSLNSISSLERRFGSGLDWHKFLAIVRRHRVAGLVYHSIGGVDESLVPHAIRQKLKDVTLILMRSNMAAARSAATITNRMEAAGISTTIIKGVPLGLMIYGSLGIRQSKDIDVLVEEQDAEAADAVLQESGYVRCVPPVGWTKEANRQFRAYRSHYVYLSKPDTPQVELHWRLQNNRYFGPMHHPLSSRRRVELATGVFVWTFEEVDLLCYLCTHGASHAWSRLKWVVDIAARLRQKPELGVRLVERAREHRTLNATGQALLLCRNLFNVPLPDNLNRPTLSMRCLESTARRTLLVGNGVDEPADSLNATIEMNVSHFFLGEGASYLLAEAQNKLLVPFASDHTKRSKPARLFAPLRQASQRLLSRR